MTPLVWEGKALPASPQFPATYLRQINQAADLDRHWFAIYTSSRHEKHVAKLLLLQQIESFLPLYRTVHEWRNRCRVELELPLFPNYLFVRIDRKSRKQVLQVPGVLALVSRGLVPEPVTDLEIESLRAAMVVHRIEPHPYLVIGERVRVNRGPLIGMEGVLVRRKDPSRVVITLDLIMRSVVLEIDADALEPVHAARHPARTSKVPTMCALGGANG